MVLHSDNGSPMKGAAMLATLQALGVMPSVAVKDSLYERPHCARVVCVTSQEGCSFIFGLVCRVTAGPDEIR